MDICSVLDGPYDNPLNSLRTKERNELSIGRETNWPGIQALKKFRRSGNKSNHSEHGPSMDMFVNQRKNDQLDGVEVTGVRNDTFDEILTTEALKFTVGLQRRFGAKRGELLAARARRQKRLDSGERPDFLPETAEIRNANWTVAPLPPDLVDRRVEITGPVERKMVINALNSGARVFMADFEDSNTPTWSNLIRANAICGTPSVAPSPTKIQRQARITRSIKKSLCCSCGLEAGTCPRVTCSSMANRSLVRYSISVYSSGTTRRNSSLAARAPISICRRSRAILRHACGTMFFSMRNKRWASSAARSKPQS